MDQTWASVSRSGWAESLKDYPRAAAHRNTMHGWLSEPRKRRGRRLCSRRLNSRYRSSSRYGVSRLGPPFGDVASWRGINDALGHATSRRRNESVRSSLNPDMLRSRFRLCTVPIRRCYCAQSRTPGASSGNTSRVGQRDPTRTVERLPAVLDKNDVVHAALDRMNRRRVIRLVE